ncbi:MAG: 50S ribosomal protein L18 [Victivallales bacterium]|nr:50S ribosomal protein L18 [Victivallales bacterium]
MLSYKTKKEKRERRHMRIRKKVLGTAECPRLSVCCTAKHIYAQFIDDDTSRTLAAVSTLDKGFVGDGLKANMQGAERLGKIAAEKAAAAKISKVVFDRGGFRYHGRVKAFAEAVRGSGIAF